jgi:hypothetical protein
MNVTTDRPAARTSLAHAIGVTAAVFSGLYFVSDVLELLHGGFSTPQLVLTYIAEAAIPLFVLGPYAVQRPHIGTLGLFGAVGYAYAYVLPCWTGDRGRNGQAGSRSHQDGT